MRTLLAVLALALAAPAIAADLPEATGMAQRGSLKVVSRVLLSPTGGEMKGVWLDGKATCLTQAHAASLDPDRPRLGWRARRPGSGALAPATVDNCAEGGPNFGFDLKPRAYKMACANGRWKPGRYSMTVKTTHVRSGLIAQASLYHQVTRAC